MKLFRKSRNRSRQQGLSPQRLRRLFVEPLEGRRLLAADLEVIKTDSPDPVTAGNNLTYMITLNNIGNEAATTVRLEDVVPDNTTFVSFDETSFFGFNLTRPNVGETGTVAAEFGSFDFGSQATFVLVVRVNPNTPAATTLSNTATATATVDDNLANNADTETTVVNTSADLSITKLDTPDPVTAGSNITYTIDVTNNGPSDAANVLFFDILPVNTTFVSFNAPAEWTPNTPPVGSGPPAGPTASAASLAAGATATFTFVVNVNPGTAPGTNIDNTANVSSDALDLNTGNNAANQLTTVQAAATPADLSIVKDDGVTAVSPGGALTYTIVVTNNGPSAVTGATVTDNFPAALTNVTFTSVATGGATGNTASGSGNIANTVNLPSGATITYTVNGTVSASATGTLSNTATVTPPASTTDSNLLNNTSTDLDTITPAVQADLGISKTDGVTTATPGTALTYTIVVSNAGPSAVTGATVTDTFPAAFTSVAYTSVAAGGATGNTASGAGNINNTVNLPVGSMITYTVTATINPSATGTLSNTAVVGVPAGVTDPNNLNNSATDNNTLLTPTANLGITKSDGVASVSPGGALTYTIVVTNAGPSAVTGATVSDTFPTALTNVTFTSTATGGATGNTASGSGNITNTVNLPVGSQITYTVNGTVSASATGSLVNTATIFAPAGVTDPTSGNNSATDTDTIVPPQPDLAVAKSDSPPDSVIAGSNLTYTIDVSNIGGGAAPNVTLTDILPANTTFVSFTAPAGWTTSTPPVGNAGTVTASNPSLAVTGTATFTLVVRVNPGAAGGSTINNTATVATSGTDASAANNTATASTGVVSQADVSVTKSDSPDPADAGSNITYTIVVSNAGPSNAQNVSLTDLLPASTTFVSLTPLAGWTISTPAVGGTGTITATNASLASGAPATFVLVVNVNAATADGATILNTATVATTSTDTTSGNNSATSTTGVRSARDFGDAPASYGTLLAGNGARHVLSSSLRLGASVDFEADGQPTANASGDDSTGTVDDEDGVVLPAGLIPGRPAAAIVTASGTGRLDAWIDFNRNGVFEASENVAANIPVVAGANNISFNVPAAASGGGTFARFRLSSAGGLAPTGQAADGEVEDYATSIFVLAAGGTAILPDPENPGQQMLSVMGTVGRDRIVVEQLRTHLLQVRVTTNGTARGPFSMANFRRIVVFAGAGDDIVEVKLGRPAALHGEGGNDTLTSSSGFDTLVGGPGNDTLSAGGGNDLLAGGEGNDTLRGGEGSDRLFGEGGRDSLFGEGGADLLLGGWGDDSLSGGGGRDVLIGGLGADRLLGNEGDDLLIGGTTAHDANQAALAAILATWNSGAAFQTRIANLRSSLNAGTVFNDGARDTLEGGVERDWLIDFALTDLIVGFASSQDRKN